MMRLKMSICLHVMLRSATGMLCLTVVYVAVQGGISFAQTRRGASTTEAVEGQHRTRLILKDGSYQIVMRYRVEGSIVRFVSAERGGATGGIPVTLGDLEATRRYEKAHAVTADPDEPQTSRVPSIDPELLKEEAERASRTPEVAPDLRLDTEDAVLLLDTFHGTPELVPLVQTGGDLNKTTGHSVLRGLHNPLASSHQIVQIPGSRSQVQAHVDTPVIYLRMGDDSGAPTGSAPFVVDTQGSQGNAPAVASGGATTSRYVIVRTDVRRDVRNVMSFQIGTTGSMVRPQEDVVEATRQSLPGEHWMKLTPRQPLGFGEYALVEIISDKAVNLAVWDFGVHPTAPENRDALKPEPTRPVTLERRPRD